MIILDLQTHPSEVLQNYQESRTRTKTGFLSCNQGFLSSLLARFEVALFFHFCYLRARSWNRMPLLGSTDWVAVLSSLLEHQLLTDPFFSSALKEYIATAHMSRDWFWTCSRMTGRLLFMFHSFWGPARPQVPHLELLIPITIQRSSLGVSFA